MTQFPNTIAGAAVLAGARRSPKADAKALHTAYASAVERVARTAAGLEPRPAPLPDGDCPLVDAMFAVEERIMDAPGGDVAMLALRLMATFNHYQRCEDDNTCTLDPLRRVRDEAAALAGVSVVDDLAAIARLGGEV